MDGIKSMVISDKTFYVGDWVHGKSYGITNGILGKAKHLFVDELPPNSVNKKFTCSIRCHNSEPYYQKSNLTILQNILLKDWIDKMLKIGILKQSCSQWSSPICVNRSNERVDVNVDYTVLNSRTISSDYYVPTHQQVLNLISPSSLFTKIVIKDAYHQLPLQFCERHMTAFATDFGHFEYTTMNANLKNANAFLQKSIEEVLKSVDQKCIAIYLDQILIFTDSLDYHLILLRNVLAYLKEFSFKLDIKECRILVCEVDYLNVKIDINGLRMDSLIQDDISNYPAPTTRLLLREFLKITNQFKFFIHDYDRLAEPLIRLSNSSFTFNWNHDAQYYFDLIKTSFRNVPSKRFPEETMVKRIV